MTPSVVLAVSFILCSIVGIASIQRDPAPRRIEERTLNFSVEENSVIGTEIGTVALTQPTEYTTPSLRYKLGTPSKLFAVDEVNGRLVTVALLDAELLCASAREQEVMSIATLNTATGVKPQGQQHSASTDSFTDKVTCSQNGIVYVHLDVNALLQDSSLRATHRVAVQVHDLNDNWPKFDQIRWHKRLNEVLYRKGRRLDLPKATDADLLEEHNRVHYRLELATENTGSPSINPTAPFRLEISPSGTPGLVLTEDLDAETKPRHHFVLVAYSPSLAWVPQASELPKQMEARLHIDIEVADMNDNEPRFDSTSYNTSVAEDTPPGTVIYEMIARDPDSTARLVYSMGSTTEATVMQSTFSIESNGAVRLRSFLDYELRHTYIVPVKVSDGEFTTQAQLFVHVLDVNDEAPEFEVNPKQLIVEENASAGKLIGRVRIRDSDSNAVNGKVHCWEPVELRRRQVVAFVPDPSTAPFSPLYDLTTRMVLDREAIPEPNEGRLLVYLVCADGNEPIDGSLLATTRHTATMTVTLTVKDDNDHSPVFLQMVYHATIYENNQLDEKIIQVNATDADEGENARITYSLLDMANFKADPITGWIMANVIFDREMRNSYQVTVFAKDQGSPIRSTSVLLHVTVLDRNDHQPQLLPHEEESSVYDLSKLQTGRVGNVNLFAVLENLPMNTHIGDVLAKDEDVGSNAEMEFMQIDDKHYSARFRILRNGSVLTAAELDREEKVRQVAETDGLHKHSENEVLRTDKLHIVLS
ncbi:unnamed protein product [Dicrocoelium dendriticum]|nr:unnamed protein product [Dicrocoelium dendriticum]